MIKAKEFKAPEGTRVVYIDSATQAALYTGNKEHFAKVMEREVIGTEELGKGILLMTLR